MQIRCKYNTILKQQNTKFIEFFFSVVGVKYHVTSYISDVVREFHVTKSISIQIATVTVAVICRATNPKWSGVINIFPSCSNELVFCFSFQDCRSPSITKFCDLQQWKLILIYLFLKRYSSYHESASLNVLKARNARSLP